MYYINNFKRKSKNMKTNDINITPVKKYASPKYPTIADAQCAPLLLRKLPSRWEKNAAVVAAVGMLGVMSLTSCGILDSKTAGYNPNSENFLNVAPVFVHGEGTGSMGCMMIAPPVFLSEQEAIAIIKSMTEDSGLNFSASPPEYIATKNQAEHLTQYSWEGTRYILGDGNVGLNLYDDKKGVAVSFISMENAELRYVNFKDEVTWESSVSSYSPRELAELTVEDFAQQNGDIAVGVFYDPGKDWESEEHQRILDEYNDSEKDWEEKMTQYENEVKLLIEENLRAQVRDFIEWLQGQGII
jgi:hypothetical protein